MPPPLSGMSASTTFCLASTRAAAVVSWFHALRRFTSCVHTSRTRAGGAADRGRHWRAGRAGQTRSWGGGYTKVNSWGRWVASRSTLSTWGLVRRVMSSLVPSFAQGAAPGCSSRARAPGAPALPHTQPPRPQWQARGRAAASGSSGSTSTATWCSQSKGGRRCVILAHCHCFPAKAGEACTSGTPLLPPGAPTQRGPGPCPCRVAAAWQAGEKKGQGKEG